MAMENETLNITAHEEPIHHGTSPATNEQQIVVACLIAVMAVWSTFGNTLTILAISLHKDMHTKCNIFILSLSVSDLLSGVIASPLWLYRRTWGFYDWRWGTFLCKAFWFADETTSYCTALHISSFAVWRYIGVKWPLRFDAISIRTIKLWLSMLWFVAFIFGGFLYSLFFDVTPKDGGNSTASHWPSCSIRIANDGLKQHKIYYTFSSTTFMITPLVVLIFTSILIAKELLKESAVKSLQRQKKEKQAVLQLAFISSSFLIGYLPIVVYLSWSTRVTSKDPLVDHWVSVAAYLLLRFSECMNPVIYNISSSRMREASISVLKQMISCDGDRRKSVTVQRQMTSRGSKTALTAAMNNYEKKIVTISGSSSQPYSLSSV